ncbi:DUF871 domain-containing protein [Pseudoteredinibacter isoporae]|uniref:Uncharacterized protein n=1 Tax=Pseudoteredinibacter isoporae TaxID=570281 RepID=A0A7X0JV31_9GAMM|nr:DUF871 domain-containing protein [Pseudoteredinibacter isoporae]MBB6522823.1 hypothetical protein [Pseudoteredinibacter isoporae]NHO88350.1 DUF871 domain-containing protein [Pseudoteredinibacter isoporae]NIB23319.1 DUF871 domain-containing protein [Pseudoteredinibacter isoporae]
MFDHIIRVSEEDLKLYIYRAYNCGRQELFTSVDLPKLNIESDKAIFQDFSQQLGENILLDSPIARKILGI